MTAINMQNILKKAGINSILIYGRNDMNNETVLQADHVWLLAEAESGYVPIDYGAIRNEPKCYEGYRFDDPATYEATMNAILDLRTAKALYPDAVNRYNGYKTEYTLNDINAKEAAFNASNDRVVSRIC